MRIVLAEDSVLLREGLIRLLREAGHDIVAAVGDAPGLIEAVHRHRPDLVVTDVRMPPGQADDGLRAAVALRRELPDIGVLVLSQYVESSYARDLLADNRGGVGYLLKDRVQDLAAIQDALDRIAGGGSVIDPEVIAQLMVRGQVRRPLSRLTDREREVLGAMAEGLTNAAIGRRLVISDGAVEKHIANIFAKLDLPPDGQAHRRVLAVLAWLDHQQPNPQGAPHGH